MQKNRVVVTGMSVCAPNGIGLKDFEANTLSGVSGCHRIDGFAIPKNQSSVAGIIKDFYPNTLFSYQNSKLIEKYDDDRHNLIANFCLDEALTHAGLSKKLESGNFVIDIILASAIGSMQSMEYSFIKKNMYNETLLPTLYKDFSFIEQAKKLRKNFKLNGIETVLPTGCVGGCDAISYAFNAIRLGKTSCAVVGAIEVPITPLVVSAFSQIKATSTRDCHPSMASCPFDISRDGFVLGEGGGILILESEAHAIRRNAVILAEIKGSASINNCFHMTDIAPDGHYIAEVCELALRDASMNYKEIDFISSHASSTQQNDVAESAAYAKVFKEKAKEIPVTALKSQIGHALSAASAIEIISAIQSIKSKKITPTINLINKDRLCDNNIIVDSNKIFNIKNVLKVSSGFSGIHSSIIFGVYN